MKPRPLTPARAERLIQSAINHRAAKLKRPAGGLNRIKIIPPPDCSVKIRFNPFHT